MPIAATSNFLLPTWTIIPEFVAFMVVLYLIAKKVIPPINQAIKTREQNIADSLAVIDEAKERQANAEVEAKRVVDDARHQARGIVDNANKVSEELQAEGRRRGEDEYGRIVGRAHGEIDRARVQAQAEMASSVADLAVETARKVLNEEIDPERHRALIEDSIAAVGSPAPGR